MYQRASGLTLVEVLITVLFLSISVIALVRFQNYLTYNDLLNQQQGEATILAEQEIETLHDFDVLATTPGYTAYNNIASGSSAATGVNAHYTITWTVTSFVNPTYLNLNVVVSWVDRNNITQSVQQIDNVAQSLPSNEAGIK